MTNLLSSIQKKKLARYIYIYQTFYHYSKPQIQGFSMRKLINVELLETVTRWTKQAFLCSKFLSPGGQLWANTAFEGSQFYSIGVPKFYSWVNVISVYAYNDLG